MHVVERQSGSVPSTSSFASGPNQFDRRILAELTFHVLARQSSVVWWMSTAVIRTW